MEVAQDIYQINVPIPNNPLSSLNVYLVKTKKGCILVDTGWNTDEAYDALVSQLKEVGVTCDDLRYIAITHAHPDHYGLVGRIIHQTKAELIIHKLEISLLQSRYLDNKALLSDMEHWLRINGVPEDVNPSLRGASMEVLGLVAIALPDVQVSGGEHLKLDDFDFEIIWTPGHSPGHICFYERERRIFISGDHVLPRITPNISMHTQSVGNPLADYINSLRQVAKLPADLVLPSHGDVFTDLKGRVKEILDHTEKRREEILAAFDSKPSTAYEIASMIKWSTGGVSWENLHPLQKRMAVTETLAHLELLFAQNYLDKTLEDGIVWYTIPGKNNHNLTK